jgi:hypothetical protein
MEPGLEARLTVYVATGCFLWYINLGVEGVCTDSTLVSMLDNIVIVDKLVTLAIFERHGLEVFLVFEEV